MGELTRAWTDDRYELALEHWDFLLREATEPLQPTFTSVFGSVFFASPSGAIWLLDPLEGSLTRRWADRGELVAELDSEQGQDEVLMSVFVQMAERAGIVPGPDEILGFTLAPAIGGSFKVDNIRCVGFGVGLNLAGQLHRQLRDKPPGWLPSSFVVEPQTPRGLFRRRR